MIVVFRNFFRNKMVNLTAKSIQHFIRGAEFHCVSFYKESPDEYKSQEPLLPHIKETLVKTKFVSGNDIQDHEDNSKTSGFQNADNVKYFAEGYNHIIEMFKDTNEKVLILGEDHFFTTGMVLSELYFNDFNLAYAPWDSDDDANASIICLRPAAVKHLFPIPEYGAPIERHLRDHLVSKTNNRYKIQRRKHINYFGDGKYTNSSAEMERELKKARII